ncbi:MAG: hypothetical protein RL757_2137 [Bacteroidota bacterium]|jgi:site-specific DNA-methyltransferase (adenine-specific)
MTKNISNLDFKNKIIVGNCLDVLKQQDAETVDLIITSPPYFQQRDYGNDGIEIGSETKETDYLNNLIEVFKECVRITKPTGAIVFNLGDKYLNGGLSLLPYKFAIRALEMSQVFLINQITWSKLNPTPRQDKRKLIQATEPFFIFAKSKNYHFDIENYLKHLDDLNKNQKNKPSDKLGKQYFDLIAQADLNVEQKDAARKALHEAILMVREGEIEGFRMKIKGVHKEAYGGMEGGRNNQIRNNGFTIIKILGNRLKKDLIESPVESTKDNDHPAVYPIYIVQELIKLLSKPDDWVVDPFVGSGTTCLAAANLGRNYLGIDINPDYVKIAEQRLEKKNYQFEIFV